MSTVYIIANYLSITNMLDREIFFAIIILSSMKGYVVCVVPEKTGGKPAGIQTALKKATTEMIVLHLLRQKPMYTYEMMSAIEKRSGGAIVFNTLYLSIYRLQEKGFIREHGKTMSEDNRTRIYFAITDTGSVYLDEIIQEYKRYTAALDRILELE